MCIGDDRLHIDANEATTRAWLFHHSPVVICQKKLYRTYTSHLRHPADGVHRLSRLTLLSVRHLALGGRCQPVVKLALLVQLDLVVGRLFSASSSSTQQTIARSRLMLLES